MENQLNIGMLDFKLKLLKFLIRRIPYKFLGIIESYIQEEQGKGFVSNVDLEVDRLISLIPQHLMSSIYALDIGANQGNWTKALKAKLPDAKVDLFEPNVFHRGSLEKLQETESDLNFFFVGLGDLPRSQHLYADSESSTMASFQSRNLPHLNIRFDSIGKVQVMRLDTVLASNQNRPNVMKIDVEGYELKVLLGATETLKGIQVLQFEFGGTALDTRIFF